MNWYYVDAGQQAGPVDDQLLASLVTSGKIQANTLVWNEGMTAWTPYAQVAPAAAATIGEPPRPDGASPGLICSECGRIFAPDQVIRHGDRWVCAACKPIFLQRLREGVNLAGPTSASTVSEAELLARDYEVDISGCLSQAWELFKANAGIFIGGILLIGLATFGVSAISNLIVTALHVRYLGFAVIVLTAPLNAGLWLLFIKKVRNQEADVSTVFSGFGPRYVQIVLTAAIPGLINLAVFTLIGLVTGGPIIATLAGMRGRSASTITPAMLLPLAIAAFVGGLIMIYLVVCWKFALPLAADKGLKFWSALQLSSRVVRKHWWMTCWLIFLSGVMTIIGLLFCLVGALVTGPTGFAMVNYHYQKVFGDLAPQNN